MEIIENTNGFTKAEIEVLELMAQGKCNNEIGLKLNIEEWALNNYRRTIEKKINSKNFYYLLMQILVDSSAKNKCIDEQIVEKRKEMLGVLYDKV